MRPRHTPPEDKTREKAAVVSLSTKASRRRNPEGKMPDERPLENYIMDDTMIPHPKVP